MHDEVFVDASFWIALMLDREEHHREARYRWQMSITNDLIPVTTNWTLYEALTHLNARTRNRHDLANRLLRLAEQTTEIMDASRYERRALDVFRSHSDKRWSIVDCASFVCIRERGVPLALSFDRDFAQAQGEFGFAVLESGASQ
jgi:predicted nucleic acid-binding protein